MINFDSLPNSNPMATVKPGYYYAEIESAEMRQGKDTNKPKYLNLKYKLTTADGKSAGTLFDIITESTAPIALFKLKCFIDAIGVDLKGENFELSMLTKVCVGKTIILSVSLDKKNNDRPQVDVFKDRIYLPKSAGSEIFNDFTEVPDGYFPDDTPISASDAADANLNDVENF